jgi:hypothetical protein
MNKNAADFTDFTAVAGSMGIKIVCNYLTVVIRP